MVAKHKKGLQVQTAGLLIYQQPIVDALRNYFCGPTSAVVDTIVLAQS